LSAEKEKTPGGRGPGAEAERKDGGRRGPAPPLKGKKAILTERESIDCYEKGGCGDQINLILLKEETKKQTRKGEGG